MNNNLAIIVGAGSNLGELKHFGENIEQRVTNNFLSLTSKETNDYPFLDYILKNAEPLNTKSNNLFSMTDGWLLLDLLGKFYLGKNNGSVYNQIAFDRIVKKYEKISDDKDDYTEIDKAIEKSHNNYCKNLRSQSYLANIERSKIKRYYPSKVSPDIYDASRAMAYFELQDLIIEKFSIDYNNPPQSVKIENSPHSTLAKLITELKKKDWNVNVINTNYDLTFESAYEKYSDPNKKPLKMFSSSSDVIPLIKPHAGFNIYHDSSSSELYFCGETIGFTPDNFTKKSFPVNPHRNDPSFEPYLIPYFLSQDEFTAIHNNNFPGVGDFFKDQEKRFKEILEKSTHVLAIGYGFPSDNDHLYNGEKEKLLKEKKIVIIDTGCTKNDIRDKLNLGIIRIPDENIFGDNNEGYKKGTVEIALESLLD